MSTNSNFPMPWQKQRELPAHGQYKPSTINLNFIDNIYFTTEQEKDRTTFNESFHEFDVENGHYYSDESITGKACKFVEALSHNREYLTNTLDITKEEYDSMSCLALAIASQETGLGSEKGYKEEQGGIKGFLRKVGILALSKKSASSGLTQIKIYDQIENNLDRWHTSILEQRGIVVDGKVSDNLKEPENSATATIVILKTIMDNYDNYREIMDEKNKIIEIDFESKGIDAQTAKEKGFKYLSDIYNKCQESELEQQKEIRNSLKHLLESTDGSTIENPSADGDLYTEEIQFERLQKALGNEVKLEPDALQYIKYALSSKECQLDSAEYCAYAWNNGIEEYGMKPDRAMSEKIGVILSTPDYLDSNDYTASVMTILEKYAQQGTSENSYFAIADILANHTK